VANGLDGKVAIVAGASSGGIGEATSKALAAEGATVVAAARREEPLSDFKGRVEGNGGRLEVMQADVTDKGQAHDLVQRAEDEFGGMGGGRPP
jgi:NADP-dependent 3-hydroxy acid dehydrogenase YdfG